MTKHTINNMPEAMAVIAAYQIIFQELLKELVKQHDAAEAAHLFDEMRARTINSLKQTTTNTSYEEETAMVGASIRFAEALFDMIRFADPDH